MSLIGSNIWLINHNSATQLHLLIYQIYSLDISNIFSDDFQRSSLRMQLKHATDISKNTSWYIKYVLWRFPTIIFAYAIKTCNWYRKKQLLIYQICSLTISTIIFAYAIRICNWVKFSWEFHLLSVEATFL